MFSGLDPELLAQISAGRKSKRDEAQHTIDNLKLCTKPNDHIWVNVSFNFLKEECKHCGTPKLEHKRSLRRAKRQLKAFS